ncbi:rhomboid family intramembrane serine protease [Pendulispora brunnea]|uniref:Rhomboid family intramembrane serine protease n=1 Tax=Pendulispora brunnea TaxID=2905690 RepID=A0ABZ2KFS2_9BACT
MSNAHEETEEYAAPPRDKTGAYDGAPFTLFVTVACVLVFIGEVWLSLVVHEMDWSQLASIVFGISPGVALTFGANNATSTLYEGRIDTLVASCFVHYGLLHLLFNLYAIRQVGPFLEHEVGTGRTSVLYVGSGIVGSMVSALYYGWYAQSQAVGAGASGAVCGLIGGAFIVGFRTQGWRSPLMMMMGIWLIITFVLGSRNDIAFIDNAAHGGGAVAGALIATVWRRGAEPTILRRISTSVAVAVVVAAAIAVVYFDFTRPFATMDVRQRLAFAQQAVHLGACDEAWAAVRTARRTTPRAPEVLQTVQYVRAHCGHDPHVPLDGSGASR